MQRTQIYRNDDLSITNSVLMETPLFKNLFIQNQELEEQVKMLKHNIMYFESANQKLIKKIVKLERKVDSYKKKKGERDTEEEVVFVKNVKKENVVKVVKDEVVVKMEIVEEVEVVKDEVVVKMEIVEDEVDETEEVETEETEETEEVEVEETDEKGTDEEVEVEETEEVEVEETEEVEVEETEEVEVEETEEVVVEEEETEEVVVEEEETEEVVVEEEETEEVVVEEEEEETVDVEGTDEEGAEEDVYEIEINGNTYYVSNEKDSVIYAADENGDISIEAGVYKNGKPVFN